MNQYSFKKKGYSMFDQKTPSEDSIIQFISFCDDAAHFKDAKTTKYIHCNKYLAKSFGIEDVEKIISCTVKDIEQMMLPYWKNGCAALIDHLDHLVKNEKQFINHTGVIVTGNGRIKLRNLIKAPFIGNDGKKVLGIFTHVQDLTHNLSREEIYKHYKAHYNGRNAVSHFLRHFELDQYFIKMPTDAELQVLLAKIIHENYKAIANYLNCATKTVDCHLARLRNKIVNGDVSQILTQARSGTTSL